MNKDIIRLTDFNKICVDAVRYTGQDRWNDKTTNKVIKVIVKISGQAYKGYGREREIINIVDEIIEFRHLVLSNYKSVYIKLTNNLKEFFFSTELDDNYRKKFLNENWYLNAHHDSCWTEGYSLTSFFTHDSKFEILEFGIGENAYKPDNNDVGWNRDDKMEEFALFDEVKNITKWKFNHTSRWQLWMSFMNEMDNNHYVKGFDIQLCNLDGHCIEKELYVYYDCNDKGLMISSKVNKKNHKATVFINEFTENKVKELFPNMGINYVSETFTYKNECMGLLINRFLDEGYVVSVKNYA